jgi:ribosome biogenesis GTPase A
VWRQLWRALERSDIAVFVLDSRIPWFHFQQAMWDYVTKVRRKLNPKPETVEQGTSQKH